MYRAEKDRYKCHSWNLTYKSKKGKTSCKYCHGTFIERIDGNLPVEESKHVTVIRPARTQYSAPSTSTSTVINLGTGTTTTYQTTTYQAPAYSAPVYVAPAPAPYYPSSSVPSSSYYAAPVTPPPPAPVYAAPTVINLNSRTQPPGVRVIHVSRSDGRQVDITRMINDLLFSMGYTHRSDNLQPARRETIKKLKQREVSKADYYEDPITGKNKAPEWTIWSDLMEKKTIVAALDCGHIFHKECIKEWIKIHSVCPICRADVE